MEVESIQPSRIDGSSKIGLKIDPVRFINFKPSTP